MGWCGAKGQTRSELVEEIGGLNVVDKGSHIWCQNGDGTISVSLIKKCDGVWMEKTMSEEEGPFCFDCPLEYLIRLPDPEFIDRLNTEWRNMCFVHQGREDLVIFVPFEDSD